MALPGVGNNASSLRGGGRTPAAKRPPIVVVDMREFRSALPSMLHARGVQLAPPFQATKA